MGSYSHRRYVSKLFQNFGKLQPKLKNERKDQRLGLSCKSHTLMLYNDIIAPSHAGGFHLLPLGLRAMEKLIKLVDREMHNIGGQKVSMTTFAPEALWQKSGRWSAAGSELFTLKDRHKNQFCLSPTHEELFTNMIAALPQLSYKQLPIRLYQITRKFRDEMAPKYGLLRGREFEMKDMYTFDTCEETALETYSTVCEAYDRIFEIVGVPFFKVSGDTGLIGGDKSHEYHYPADIGQDTILLCDRCGVEMNKELVTERFHMGCVSFSNVVISPEDGSSPVSCQLPGENCALQGKKAIEIAHAFYLGDKYSSIFKASYRDSAGDKQINCSMGCYGIGVTRMLQAAIECLSSDKQIRWPSCFAPYQICIIPKKDGKQGNDFLKAAELVSDNLSRLPNLEGEIVIDDRMTQTIGRRQLDSDRLGFPFIVILGKQALDHQPMFEVIDTEKQETVFMSPEQLHDFASQIKTLPIY